MPGSNLVCERPNKTFSVYIVSKGAMQAKDYIKQYYYECTQKAIGIYVSAFLHLMKATTMG